MEKRHLLQVIVNLTIPRLPSDLYRIFFFTEGNTGNMSRVAEDTCVDGCVVKQLFLEDINFLSKINLHRGVIEGAMIIKIETHISPWF